MLAVRGPSPLAGRVRAGRWASAIDVIPVPEGDKSGASHPMVYLPSHMGEARVAG